MSVPELEKLKSLKVFEENLNSFESLFELNDDLD